MWRGIAASVLGMGLAVARRLAMAVRRKPNLDIAGLEPGQVAALGKSGK